MKYVSVLVILFSAILMGCPSITPVEVPLPPHESKLVMNGVLNNKSLPQIFLSYSRGVRDTFSRVSNYVEGAKVIMFEEDELIGELQARKRIFWEYLNDDSFLVTQTYYQGDFFPEAGKRYRVEASHPDYDPVWAETVLPIVPEIDNEIVEINQILDQSGTYFSSYSFSILSETPSYMRLRGGLSLKDTVPFLPGKDFAINFDTPLNDPKYETWRTIYWLNDVGETAQVFFSSAPLNNPPPEVRRFYFNYAFLDSTYYAYRIAFKKHNESAFNQPNFVFPIERTEIPSNVYGGYGMVGSFIEVRDSL